MSLSKKTGESIDVCAHPDGQLIIQLIGHGWLDINKRKCCRSDGRIEGAIYCIAGVQSKRGGETESDRHVRQAIPSKSSQVCTHVAIARWGKRDTSSKVSSTVYPGRARELDGPSNQGCSAEHLDPIHLAQSCRVVMNGRGIIGLCGKGIPLPSSRGALRLKSNALSRGL